MVIQLFGHPFSSYTWKAEIAFYENDTPFEFRIVDPEHPENSAELARRSAMGKFPLLVEGSAAVFEATAIIEYSEAVHPGWVVTCEYDILRDEGELYAMRLMDAGVVHPASPGA